MLFPSLSKRVVSRLVGSGRSLGLYEWILEYNFVEGRYWGRVWDYGFDDNFRDSTPPANIVEVNVMLKQLLKNNGMPIFIDYYKKVDNKLVSD